MTGQFWRIFCIVFVKSVLFLICQIRHGYLLCFKQLTINISTSHGM
jgi:hypothetical protein